MASVIDTFKKDSDSFQSLVAVTAQHRQMLDQVLSLFEIKPDYDLNLMTNNQSLSSLSAKIMVDITKVLEKEKPDLVFVQGDTTSTFIGSLAAFYLKIPIAHIEAGLRTNNIYSPFPEEVNRRLTSSIVSFHFTPTEKAKQNLLAEGVSLDKIFVTGNTVIDALLMILKKIENNSLDLENYFRKKHNQIYNG